MEKTLRTFISKIQTRQFALTAANNALEERRQNNKSLDYVEIECINEEVDRNDREVSILFTVMDKINEISTILEDIPTI